MFADRIKEARKQKKISQEKLSEMLNVSQSAISSYESGARKPDIDFLPQIAKALDVSVSYLLGRDEEQPQAALSPADRQRRDVEAMLRAMSDADLEKVYDYVRFVAQNKK